MFIPTIKKLHYGNKKVTNGYQNDRENKYGYNKINVCLH